VSWREGKEEAGKGRAKEGRVETVRSERRIKA
jgi:hypothetical protein